MPTDKRHLFFDLDDTLTPSRSQVNDAMQRILTSLPADIVVVSGARVERIAWQMREVPVYRLGQNGNDAYTPTGEQLWQDRLSDEQRVVIREHIDRLRSAFAQEVRDESDLVDDRDAQISYSMLGHNEDLALKKAFDPTRAIRTRLLTTHPLTHPSVEVRIGGTTCFDYTAAGRHKGYNVGRLIAHMGWEPQACIYFGDALVPGGNDETVIGVIDTYPVRDSEHTREVLACLWPS